MVPGLGVEPRRARGPRDFKATGERQRIKDLANSLPFPVSEESEEGRGVRGLWTPRWTPVAGDVEGEGQGARPGADRHRLQGDDGRESAISTRGRDLPSDSRPGAPPKIRAPSGPARSVFLHRV